jgi:hypothetical protein
MMRSGLAVLVVLLRIRSRPAQVAHVVVKGRAHVGLRMGVGLGMLLC